MSLRSALLAALLFAPVGARADETLVFAAASMKTALDEIADDFAATTGHGAAISYAGSSALARQIQAGAPADVFISANVDWMDVLEAEGRIAPESRVDLVGNAIVLIAADPEAATVAITPEFDLAGLLDGGRLAMALVDAVPAGIYGKAALDTLGLWTSVASQVAQTDNVRAALALVATGAAPYGVVYRSDAIAEPRVHVVATFPEESHPPIVYPVAMIAGHDGAAPRAFLDTLRSPEARAVFEAQGFTWLGP
ncbi:MAG: molybdate ABC transporter substrate-binding protein [Paracoccaceae bacterium]